MSNKQKISLVAAGVVIVVVSLYLVGIDFEETGMVQEGQEVEVIAEEVEVNETEVEEIDTSDWLTYRNEEYGFSLKYPAGWEVREKSKNYVFLFSPNNLEIISRQDYTDQHLGYLIRIEEGQSLKKYITRVWSLDKFRTGDFPEHPVLKNIYMIIEGELIGYKFIGEGWLTYAFQNGNFIYIIERPWISTKSDKENEDTIFEAVISTLNYLKN